MDKIWDPQNAVFDEDNDQIDEAIVQTNEKVIQTENEDYLDSLLASMNAINESNAEINQAEQKKHKKEEEERKIKETQIHEEQKRRILREQYEQEQKEKALPPTERTSIDGRTSRKSGHPRTRKTNTLTKKCYPSFHCTRFEDAVVYHFKFIERNKERPKSGSGYVPSFQSGLSEFFIHTGCL